MVEFSRLPCVSIRVGFTGPFFHRSHFPECGESRYHGALLQDQGVIHKPRKQFSIILLGPQTAYIPTDRSVFECMGTIHR